MRWQTVMKSKVIDNVNSFNFVVLSSISYGLGNTFLRVVASETDWGGVYDISLFLVWKHHVWFISYICFILLVILNGFIERPESSKKVITTSFNNFYSATWRHRSKLALDYHIRRIITIIMNNTCGNGLVGFSVFNWSWLWMSLWCGASCDLAKRSHLFPPRLTSDAAFHSHLIRPGADLGGGWRGCTPPPWDKNFSS